MRIFVLVEHRYGYWKRHKVKWAHNNTKIPKQRGTSRFLRLKSHQRRTVSWRKLSYFRLSTRYEGTNVSEKVIICKFANCQSTNCACTNIVPVLVTLVTCDRDMHGSLRPIVKVKSVRRTQVTCAEIKPYWRVQDKKPKRVQRQFHRLAGEKLKKAQLNSSLIV